MNNENTINVGEAFGSDLSSRTAGNRLRKRIELLATKGTKVIVDLSRVRSLSHSFADEVFAVLIKNRGEEWFRVNVSLTGADSFVRQTILDAIACRLGGGSAVKG